MGAGRSPVKKLDYRPNHAARTLRSQQSTTIGLIVSDIRNPFFTAVSRAVEDMAHEAGYSVFLCNTDENPEKEAIYLKLMGDENVAGAIYSPTRHAAERFDPSKLNFPTVIVDRDVPSDTADMILIDNVSSGYQLAKHLLENGHRRIFGMFGEASTTGRQRHEGMLKALQEYHLSLTGEVFIQPRIESGFEAAQAALKSAAPLTQFLHQTACSLPER